MPFQISSLNGCPCICHTVGRGCVANDNCCEYAGQAWGKIPVPDQAAATGESSTSSLAEA